jgi:hypothetical protein
MMFKGSVVGTKSFLISLSSFSSSLENLPFGFGRLFLFTVWTGSFKPRNKSKSLTEHRTWVGLRIGLEEGSIAYHRTVHYCCKNGCILFLWTT